MKEILRQQNLLLFFVKSLPASLLGVYAGYRQRTLVENSRSAWDACVIPPRDSKSNTT
jgi:hypothetical protein